MQTPIDIGRGTYRSSGSVSWLRFMPITIGAWLLCALLGLVLHFLLVHSLYMFIVVPIVTALALMGLIMLVVNHGHCRNRFAAGFVGVVAAVVTYLGYYHVTMVAPLGPQFVHRVDLLPRYIMSRIIGNS